MLDAVRQRLVVGRLEVQAWVVLDRAPVAAVHHRGLGAWIDHQQRAGDIVAIAHGDHQQQVLGHRPADLQEAVEVQVGRRMVLAVGGPIAAVEEAPVGLGGRGAGYAAEGDARVVHAAAFGADVLALLLLQCGQEVIEAGEPGIAPVELHSLPQQHAGIAHQSGFVGGGEQHMQRRQPALPCHGQRGFEQRGTARRIAGQQPCTLHRRERHGGQPLRVVLQPMLRVRIGPRPVEHVFAVRVALHIERHGRGQDCLPGVARGVFPQGQVLGRPAGLGRGAAAGVQCMQEIEAQERRGAGLPCEQIVPRGASDLAQIGHQPRAIMPRSGAGFGLGSERAGGHPADSNSCPGRRARLRHRPQ